MASCFGRDALDTPEVLPAAVADSLRQTVQIGPESLQENAGVLHIIKSY